MKNNNIFNETILFLKRQTDIPRAVKNTFIEKDYELKSLIKYIKKNKKSIQYYHDKVNPNLSTTNHFFEIGADLFICVNIMYEDIFTQVIWNKKYNSHVSLGSKGKVILAEIIKYYKEESIVYKYFSYDNINKMILKIINRSFKFEHNFENNNPSEAKRFKSIYRSKLDLEKDELDKIKSFYKKINSEPIHSNLEKIFLRNIDNLELLITQNENIYRKTIDQLNRNNQQKKYKEKREKRPKPHKKLK
jgi:hypothetical protein